MAGTDVKRRPVVYTNSRMKVYYADDRPVDMSPCEVKFVGNQVIVSYIEDGEHCLWRGSEHGPGHYECRMETGGKGKATLHRFQNGTFLEGYWEEGDEEETYDGMWRIDLGPKIAEMKI